MVGVTIDKPSYHDRSFGLLFLSGAAYWDNRSRSMFCSSQGPVNSKVPTETATNWCVAVLPLLSLPPLTVGAVALLGFGDVDVLLLEASGGFGGTIVTVMSLR
jgi:hypothetical protein